MSAASAQRPGRLASAPPSPQPANPAWRRSAALWLTVIALWAAAVRLIDLDGAPPGLNQDEAANAWNAYCLLRTGQDQAGDPWPIFHFRALGEHRTPLFLYLMLPFQAIGGLNIWTTRLPNVAGGVACVLLIYYIGRRLFGQPTGLVAAALMALNPWAIHNSRWGHEGSATALLVLLPLAAWLWAGLPLIDQGERRPSPWRALLAGLVTGACCYGYPALRLFLPLFFTAAVVISAPAWLRMLRSGRGVGAFACVVAGGLLTFGPLAWRHLTDPEIGKRGQFTWVWLPEDSLATKIGKAAGRYPMHFGPGTLFATGDQYPIVRTAVGGLFEWYALPLMLAGAVVLVARLRGSAAARLLVLWLLLYPAGDVLSGHFNNSLHGMRSLPGLGALVLLAALGATWLGGLIARRGRRPLVVAGAALALVALASHAYFLYQLFGPFYRTPVTFQNRTYDLFTAYQSDLVDACNWLRPRLGDIDAVFVTTSGLNQPYIVSLVSLGYDPRQWLADRAAGELRIEQLPQWDVILRYGKMHFLYGSEWQQKLAQMGQAKAGKKVYLIVRPGESRMENPVHVVRDPAGRPALLVFSVTL